MDNTYTFSSNLFIFFNATTRYGEINSKLSITPEFISLTSCTMFVHFLRVFQNIVKYTAIQGRPRVLPCPREPDGTPWMVHEVKNKQAKFYFPQTRFVKAPPLSGVDATPSIGTSFGTFLDFWKVCNHGQEGKYLPTFHCQREIPLSPKIFPRPKFRKDGQFLKSNLSWRVVN